MFKKNSFFKKSLIKNSKYKTNILKAKKAFKFLKEDFQNNEIPFLETFRKNYKFEFSLSTIKKYHNCDNIIIIGMGGSILGIKSIYSFLKEKIKKNVFFFDNLDSNLNLEFKKIKKINKSCFIIVSKSGNTLETITNLTTIFSKKLLKNKIVIITEIKDSDLMEIGNKFGAEIIEHKEFVGGRYSVLSEAGMFPAALLGLKLINFKNFDKLIKNKSFILSLIEDVAAIYTLHSKKINNSVILSYDSSLNNLGYWYQQLVAESLGKKKKGINPIISFGPKDHHSLLQLYLDGPRDKFFTFMDTKESVKKNKIIEKYLPDRLKFLKNKTLDFVVKAQTKAAKNIFKIKNIPFREITFNNKNEEELGQIFIFFVLETILLSRLMNINPFDQPAVEEVKIETQKFLR